MAHENEIVDLSKRDFLGLNSQDKKNKEVTEHTDNISWLILSSLWWLTLGFFIAQKFYNRKLKIILKEKETRYNKSKRQFEDKINKLENELEDERFDAQKDMLEIEISYHRRIESLLERWNYVLIETDRKLKVVWVNQNIENSLWYEKVDLVWKHITEIVPEEDKNIFTKILYWLTNKIYWNNLFTEVRLQNSEWENIFFEIWLIVSANNEIVTYIFKDNSLRRNIEDANIQKNKELYKQHKELESSLKNEEDMSATLSHDIRGGLGKIKAILYLLYDTPLTPEQKDILDKSINNIDILVKIANASLDLKKIREWKMDLENISFSLWQELDSIFNLIYTELIGKWLDLNINIEPEVSNYYYWDPTRLTQIFLNLINNAIKFTKSWSISFNAYKSDKHIVFEIVDTWIWIKKENIDKIFEKYTQETLATTRQSGWSWYWLSIVKDLTDLMWGEIYVKSEVWKGSSFSVSIPLAQSDENKEDISYLKDKKVCLVSDKKEISTLLKNSSNFLWNIIETNTLIAELKTKINNDELIIVAWDIESEVSKEFPSAKNIYYAGYQVKDEHTIYLPITLNKYRNLLLEFFNPEKNTSTWVSESKEIVQRNEKILIWEDKPTLAILLKTQLKNLWFSDIDICEDKDSLINAFLNKEYDYIFLDNQLANWDLWYEVSYEMRVIEENNKDRKKAKIISCSWDISEEIIKRNSQNWIDWWYFTKPFINWDKLEELLKKE